MKCHICNRKIDENEDYVTKIFRKMLANKRARMHKKCWESHLKKF